MQHYFKIEDSKYHLELDLNYQKGGLNYGNLKTEKRGIYLNISTVEKSKTGVTRLIFGNFGDLKSGKILIMELSRKNTNRLNKLDDKINYAFIADKWIKKEYSKVSDYLSNEIKGA